MKKLLLVSVYGFICFSFIMVSSISGVAKEKPINLVYSSAFLESAIINKVEKWYFNEVQKRTNGKVKVEMHFGGELTKGPETLKMLKTGAVDICDTPPAYFPDQFPLAGLFNACRIAKDCKMQVEKGWEIFFSDDEIAKALEEEAAKQKHKILMQIPVSYRFITHPPVKTLSDMKGLKFRSTGVYEPKQKGYFGAIPVNIWPSEWYESMARGNLDAVSMVWEFAHDYKLQEVAKYVSFWDGAIFGAGPFINTDVWNNLPDDVKRVMMQVRDDAPEYELKLYAKQAEYVEQIYKEAGVKVLDVDPEEQETLFDSWIKVVIKTWLPNVRKRGQGDIGEKLLDRWLRLTREGKGLDYWKNKFDL